MCSNHSRCKSSVFVFPSSLPFTISSLRFLEENIGCVEVTFLPLCCFQEFTYKVVGDIFLRFPRRRTEWVASLA